MNFAQRQDTTQCYKMFEENIKLVTYVIRHYFLTTLSSYRIEFDDLFQVGCIGLYKAVLNYDPSFGVQFSTYAVPMIKGELSKYCRDLVHPIKIPRSLKEIFFRIVKLERQGYTKEEILKKLGISEKQYNRAKKAFQPLIYLDAEVDDEKNESTLFSIIESDYDLEEDATTKLQAHQVMKLLSEVLSEKEMSVLKLAVIKGWTQRHIARVLGISQTSVSRVLKKIERKVGPAIKSYLEGDPRKYNELKFRRKKNWAKNT